MLLTVTGSHERITRFQDEIASKVKGVETKAWNLGKVIADLDGSMKTDEIAEDVSKTTGLAKNRFGIKFLRDG